MWPPRRRILLHDGFDGHEFGGTKAHVSVFSFVCVEVAIHSKGV